MCPFFDLNPIQILLSQHVHFQHILIVDAQVDFEKMASDFQNGLFGCLRDPVICLKGWCCPCWLDGETEALLGGDCMMTCLCDVMTMAVCPCICQPCRTRAKVRQQFGIAGSGTGDCCIICCCWNCAACQQYYETLDRTKSGEPPSQRMEY